MADKVEFPTNIPVPIVLAYDDGREVEGKFGTQVMYSLEGGRVMYVPPVVQEQIRKARHPQGRRVLRHQIRSEERHPAHHPLDRGCQRFIRTSGGTSGAAGGPGSQQPAASRCGGQRCPEWGGHDTGAQRWSRQRQ